MMINYVKNDIQSLINNSYPDTVTVHKFSFNRNYYCKQVY